MARNLDLEAAIIRSPDDFTNYVVYSDWLIEQGDPRGELITLQRLRKQSEWEALLKAQSHHFWGSLADFDDIITDVEWHMGFIKKCRFANTFARRDDPGDTDLRDVLAELLKHPSSVFLRELTVGILEYDDNDYSWFFRILGENPKPLLQKLYVGDFSSEETELNWSSIGTTGPLWTNRAAEALETLTLRSGSMELYGIDAPSLRELSIVTGGLDSVSLSSLCGAQWPNLHTLSLQLGENRFEINELKPIFDGSNFPKLRHLGLTNTAISDLIAEAIIESRIVKQLETLDLTLGTMSDEGALALSRGRAALAHLKRLDVSENFLSKAGGDGLKGVCAAVFDAAQRDDGGSPGGRYIAAYE